MSSLLSLLLLCGFVGHVTAGATCKDSCEGIAPKRAGDSVSAFVQLGMVEKNCAGEADIECAEGEVCTYERLETRVVLTGQPEQTGIKTTIKCDTEANFLAKTCASYDEIYPMEVEGYMVQNLDSCSISKGDDIPLSALGKEDPFTCNECLDVVKIDADGVEEAVGAATCATAAASQCNPAVTQCARITLTYAIGEENFRRNQVACHDEGLTCESLKAGLGEGATVTDCALGDRQTPVEEENEEEKEETEEEKDEDEDNEVETEGSKNGTEYNVVEEKAKGSSSIIATLSTILFFITLSHLW